MKPRKTMTYAVALAAASTLALAGCNGGDDEATSTPKPTSSATSASPSGSASGTASPTPSTSVSIPTAARAKTDAGAQAFLRFYFDQVNDAYTRPDAMLLPGLSNDSCQSCSGIQQGVTELTANDQRMKSAVVMPLTQVKISGGAPEGETWITFKLSQATVPVVDATGKESEGQKASVANKIASLVWKDGQWRVHGIANH